MIDSIISNDIIEIKELNEKVNKAEKPEDAADIVKQYEDNIRTKDKNISTEYHQAKVFKRFKDTEKLIKLVNEFKVHKSTIIFKKNIFKLIGKHLKFMKSSVTLGVIKNCYKDIKQIFNENSKLFV